MKYGYYELKNQYTIWQSGVFCYKEIKKMERINDNAS